MSNDSSPQAMIEFSIVAGKLVCDPGVAGKAAIKGLAEILGMEAVQITNPAVQRTTCTMSRDEYDRRLAQVNQPA
jgi:hypothetical protein